MNYIEKYIDLTETSSEYEINKHIANGWYIHDQGLTYVIIRKIISVEVI